MKAAYVLSVNVKSRSEDGEEYNEILGVFDSYDNVEDMNEKNLEFIFNLSTIGIMGSNSYKQTSKETEFGNWYNSSDYSQYCWISRGEMTDDFCGEDGEGRISITSDVTFYMTVHPINPRITK